MEFTKAMKRVIQAMKDGNVITAKHELTGATATLHKPNHKVGTRIDYRTWEALYKRGLLSTQTENDITGTYALSKTGESVSL